MDAKTVKDFISIIKEDKTTVGPYDTTATVVRVEGSTAWVHIPGGVDETPVAMSINAEAGDTVRVRVSGGQAWLMGNDTAPPTDDKTATEAKTVASLAVKNVQILDENLNQQEIFDRLTNNGTAEGLYMVDGDLYVNASFIHSGTLTLGGLNNEDGLLQVMDANGDLVGSLSNTGLYAVSGEIGGWSIGSIRLTKSSAVTSGTASTQYGAMIQAPASPGTGDTAFGVRKRSYDGSSYGSWSYNFYVTYGGAMRAKNATFDDYIYVDGNAESLIKLENGPNDIQLWYGGLQCSIDNTSTLTETAHYTVMQRMYTSDNAYQTYIDCKRWIISSKTFINPASLPTGMTYVHVTNSGITRFSSGTLTASIGDTFTTYGDNAFEARTGFTIGTPPSSNTGKTGYFIQDSAGNNMARWDAYYYSDGRYGLRFGTARSISGGTDVGNFLLLSIDSSGNRYVGFSESAVWRNALGFDRFQNIVTESSDSSSSATFSHTLESGGIYLVIVDKINTTSANYVGMYIVGIHSNNSNVKAILSATSATVSVSTTTLTITLSATYMKVAIYRIS